MTEVTASRLFRLLADIETALPALSAHPAVREVGSQVRSGSSVGSRPPGNLDVLDLTWWASNQAVLPKLLSWAVMIAEESRDLGVDDPGPVDASLVEVCRYLRARVTFVVTQPWADELELEWSEMRAVVARAPGSPLFGQVLERVRCVAEIGDVGRRCLGMVETRLLRRGDRVVEMIRCDTCGTVYADAAMKILVDERAAERMLPATVTAGEAVTRLAVSGLTVTEEQIRQWATRGTVSRRPRRGAWRTYDLDQVAVMARRAHDRTHPGVSPRTVTPTGTDAP